MCRLKSKPIKLFLVATAVLFSVLFIEVVSVQAAEFELNNRVELFQHSNIRAAASLNSTLTGINLRGWRGTIVDGPEPGPTSDTSYYKIDFDRGVWNGWVLDDNLESSVPAVIRTPNYFKVGDNVQLFRVSNFRNEPLLSQESLKGTRPKNSNGVIAEGPTIDADRNVWYRIDFGTPGTSGWVASDNFILSGSAGAGSTGGTGGSTGAPGDTGGAYIPPVGTQCRVVWSPSAQALASGGWNSGNVYVGGQSRVRYEASQNAVRINQVAGVPKQLSEYRPGSPWVAGNTARQTVQVFIPNGFDGNSGSRFGIGIRGGGSSPANRMSGSWTVAEQDGWSYRINYTDDFKPTIYTYNLNRDNAQGDGYRLAKSLPTGQWMTLVLDISLNAPGQANGSASLKVYNANGSLYDSRTANNLVWRRNTNWNYVGGVILTDKIEAAPSKNQYILYRNFKLEVGNGVSCG